MFGSVNRTRGDVEPGKQPFKGKIGETYRDSTPVMGMFASHAASKGAPNILLIMIVDGNPFGISYKPEFKLP